jgi:hypothetical protein
MGTFLVSPEDLYEEIQITSSSVMGKLVTAQQSMGGRETLHGTREKAQQPSCRDKLWSTAIHNSTREGYQPKSIREAVRSRTLRVGSRKLPVGSGGLHVTGCSLK